MNGSTAGAFPQVYEQFTSDDRIDKVFTHLEADRKDDSERHFSPHLALVGFETPVGRLPRGFAPGQSLTAIIQHQYENGTLCDLNPRPQGLVLRSSAFDQSAK
jgi:hypothetical protein